MLLKIRDVDREAVPALLIEFLEPNWPRNVSTSSSSKLKQTRPLMVGHVMNSTNLIVALYLEPIGSVEDKVICI